MDKKIFKAFDKITAESELKEKTLEYLNANINDGACKEKPQKPMPYKKHSLRLALAVFAIVLAVVGWNALNATRDNVADTQTDAGYMPQGNAAVAYVDIDVNPSIELALDNTNRVVSTRAYNEDGEIILAEANVEGRLYDAAVKALVEDMISAGYLEKGGLISLTLQAGANDESSLLSGLDDAIQSVLEATDTKADVDIFPVSNEIKEYSHSHSLSPAKYLAITELQQLDSTATYEGCSGHSLSQIHHMTQQIRQCEDGNHEDCVDHHGNGPAGGGGGQHMDHGQNGHSE